MTNTSCPACGSEKIIKKEKTVTEHLSQGPDFTYAQENYSCADCGEEGDFAQVNDERFLASYNSALAVSVKQTVSDLSEQNNISMALFERAFELPTRTLTRWKNGEFSATAVALLRTVNTFPWLAEIAANKFDLAYAKSILLREGWKILSESMQAKGISTSHVSFEPASANTIVATAKFEKKIKPSLSVVEEQVCT